MQAVVLAGGEGVRLRPLTSRRPKPLVEVANKPIMGHVIDLLRRNGMTDVIAAVHYLAEAVQGYFGDGGAWGVRLRYAVEDRPLGTAGCVRSLAGWFSGGALVVVSGDALTDIDLREAFEFHKDRQAVATLVLSAVTDPRQYGVVVTDAAGRVRRFVEKPGWSQVISDTVNTGIYVLEPQVLDDLQPGAPADFAQDLFPRLLALGAPVYGFRAEGYWCDVGTLAAYRQAQWDALVGRVRVEMPAQRAGEAIWLGDGAAVAPGATITGPALVGAGCRVGAGARLGPGVVLGQGVIVDSDASLEQAIVGSESRVGPGAYLFGAVVGAGVRLEARCRLEEGAVIGDGCVLGDRVQVLPGVKVWPDRTFAAGALVSRDPVSQKDPAHGLFDSRGAGGRTNVECTPEFGLRLGEAFGASLCHGYPAPTPAGGHLPEGIRHYAESAGRPAVAAAADGASASRGICQAAVAGLLATGARVHDLGQVPIWLFRRAVRALSARGGLYVRRDPDDPHVTRLVLLDGRGIDIGRSTERRIEEWFSRDGGRLRPPEETGHLLPRAGAFSGYRGALLARAVGCALGAAPYRVRVAVQADSFLWRWLTSFLRGLSLDMIPVEAPEGRELPDPELPALAGTVARYAADAGVRLDAGGERIAIVDETARPITGPKLLGLTASLALALHSGAALAVPASAPDALEAIAREYGGRVVRTGHDLSALMETVAHRPEEWALAGDTDGRFIFPEVGPGPDGLFALAFLLDALGRGRRLSDLAARLPSSYLQKSAVPCAWEEKGRVMRLLGEQAGDLPADCADGVKILHEEGWVLARPHDSRPALDLVAEGRSQEAAQRLLALYAQRITQWRRRGA